MTQRARMYFTLAAVGLAAQVAVLVVFFADVGFDLGELADQAVDSTIAVLSLVDIAFSALIFVIWSAREARRVGIEPYWPFVVSLLGGVCFALALFLGYRERRVAGVASGQAGHPATATAETS